jgi:hypothetical protein
MPRWDNIFRVVDGQEIKGTYLNAFIHNGTYYQTEIKIYADGMIDAWELMTFEEFKEKVAEGWVVTTLPEGAKVRTAYVDFTAINVSSWVKEVEFIKEVQDEIDALNNRPTTSDRCREAYARFNENQSEANRVILRQAYEAIPEHNRQYVLHDMDVKDIPVRMIIYGEDEIEKWIHRIVARASGVKSLPSIYVKGALKRRKRKTQS